MPKNLTKSGISFLIFLLIFTACKKQEENQKEEPKAIKEVEVFIPNQEKIDIALNKNGVTSSYITAQVTPEVTGKITKLNVKLGDTVSKNQTLFQLGNSLGTDINEIQESAAIQQKNIADESLTETEIAGEGQLISAELGIQNAFNTYKSAKKSQDLADELFEDQYNNLLIESDNAEIGYESSKDTYYDLIDQIDLLEESKGQSENKLEDLVKNLNINGIQLDDATKKQIQDLITSLQSQLSSTDAKIAQLEAQKDGAKSAMEIAENRMDQAEIGLQQLVDNNALETEKLENLIDSALIQYKSSIAQTEALRAQTALQKLGIKSQIIQAETGVLTSALQGSYTSVKSPIDGKITAINIDEGNLVTPGQIVMKIESDKQIKIKTSLSLEEVRLIDIRKNAKVKMNTQEIEAQITALSPIPNELTKKADIELGIPINREIPPGAFVIIEFPIEPQHVFVPLNSVSPGDESELIKIVDDTGKIKEIPIKTGEIIGDYIEVVSGLRGTEKVVLSSTYFLQEGDEVNITNLKIKR